MSFNPNQWYLMGSRQYGGPANTFIGGVSSVINTPALLAAKFLNYPSGTTFDVANIYNFTIVGDDIECYIGVDYRFISNAFWGVPSITNYFDVAKRLKSIPGSDTFYQSKANFTRMYFPALIEKFGPTQGEDPDFFTTIASNGIIYMPPFFATSNAGAEEGDVAFLRSLGWSVRYISNFTAPSDITNLTIGTITSTTLQLNFTVPSSTNTIDFYEVWLNGVKTDKTVTASGQNITGLTSATLYNVQLKAVDIYYNKSELSNTASATTS